MKRFYTITELDNFKSNLLACLNNILCITVKDLSVMTGIPMSTLETYKRSESFLSPPISNCKKIADAFCTSVETMCNEKIDSDIDEVVRIQEAFIKRAGGVDGDMLKSCYKELRHGFDCSGYLPGSVVLLMLKEKYIKIIKSLGKKAICSKASCDDIAEIFTVNLNRLKEFTELKDVDIHKKIYMSQSSVGRYCRGAEPPLDVVVAFSKCFKVSITELLTRDLKIEEGRLLKMKYSGATTRLCAVSEIHDGENPEGGKEKLLDRHDMESLARKHMQSVSHPEGYF